MRLYRKKPVVIEAFQMTPERRVDNSEWPEWMHRAWNAARETLGSLYPTVAHTGDGTLSIGTLEGQHLVSWGDWIIQGVKGELYPCKPDIFEVTYEAIDLADGATWTPVSGGELGQIEHMLLKEIRQLREAVQLLSRQIVL